MKSEKKKLNLHAVSNEDGLYFWDRIDAAKLKKCTIFLILVLACLPVLASLTVRLWIYVLKGARAAQLCDGWVMNQYWFSLMYLLGTVTFAVMAVGCMKRYSVHSLACLRKKDWVLSHWLSLNLFAMLLWSTISFLLAKDKDGGIWGDSYCHEGLLMYYFYAAFFMIGSWQESRHMKLTAEVLALICAISGILVITEAKLIPGLFFIVDHERVMFHNRNHYGYFLSICAPLTIGLALHDTTDSKVFKAGRILELWLIFNALIACNTRGSFIAVIIVTVFWNIYVCLQRKDLKKRMLTIDIMFLVTILFLNSGSEMLGRIAYFAHDVKNVQAETDKVSALDEMGTGRGILMRYGIQFAMEKPLFGYGPGNIFEPYKNAGCRFASPHNDLILMAASIGMPVVVFYISGLAAHLKGFFHFVKKMPVFHVALYASLASYMFSSMVGVSTYYVTPYYFLILGFTYGLYKQYSREERAVNPQSTAVEKSETEQNPVCEENAQME